MSDTESDIEAGPDDDADRRNANPGPNNPWGAAGAGEPGERPPSMKIYAAAAGTPRPTTAEPSEAWNDLGRADDSTLPSEDEQHAWLRLVMNDEPDFGRFPTLLSACPISACTSNTLTSIWARVGSSR